MNPKTVRARRPLSLVLTLAVAFGCTTGEPPEPEAGSFEWTTYTNREAGYSIQVPDVYAADEEPEGRAVLFRAADGVPVKVYWMNGEEGAHRGLWFDETPAGTTSVAGVDGRRYEYTHCDGPLCSRMVSFVIPHRGRSLAVEFRSDGPLHPTNERILASVRLAGEAGA